MLAVHVSCCMTAPLTPGRSAADTPFHFDPHLPNAAGRAWCQQAETPSCSTTPERRGSNPCRSPLALSGLLPKRTGRQRCRGNGCRQATTRITKQASNQPTRHQAPVKTSKLRCADLLAQEAMEPIIRSLVVNLLLEEILHDPGQGGKRQDCVYKLR